MVFVELTEFYVKNIRVIIIVIVNYHCLSEAFRGGGKRRWLHQAVYCRKMVIYRDRSISIIAHCQVGKYYISLWAGVSTPVEGHNVNNRVGIPSHILISNNSLFSVVHSNYIISCSQAQQLVSYFTTCVWWKFCYFKIIKLSTTDPNHQLLFLVSFWTENASLTMQKFNNSTTLKV